MGAAAETRPRERMLLPAIIGRVFVQNGRIASAVICNGGWMRVQAWVEPLDGAKKKRASKSLTANSS